LSFGGNGRGRKDLRGGKLLFGNFKKIRKDFGGLILSNFKVPLNWEILES
jgi:hypothetical protein